jgi:hypothetical protein
MSGILRWSVSVLLVLLALAYWHGSNLRTQAQAECLPGVPAYSTGHMHFNPCATLDASQVQDKRWPMATDSLYVCTEEDGSGPGQPFPCLWEASLHGNGKGDTYVLDAPNTLS